MKAKSFGLRRGMYVELPDGSVARVDNIFRSRANTRYRKEGALMFQSDEWLWHDVASVKILGFGKGKHNKQYDTKQ